MMWTLESALALVAVLQPEMAARGWHIALGGGVLHKGTSKHDLDLILFPHDSHVIDMCAMAVVLLRAGWLRTHSVRYLHSTWRNKGSADCKHVEVWKDRNGRRIDIIIPSISDVDHAVP